MDTIIIRNLEVFFRVGVPAEERKSPQRLQLSLELAHDFAAAARSDDLSGTIDYYAVACRVRELGEGREWRLIETLAEAIAGMILSEFQPRSVVVEVRKFIIPETEFVAVRIARP